MMKKLTFVKLRERLHLRRNHRSITACEHNRHNNDSNNENCEECDECDKTECESYRQICAQISNTSLDTKHNASLFPQLLRSFRNRFKRNNNNDCKQIPHETTKNKKLTDKSKQTTLSNNTEHSVVVVNSERISCAVNQTNVSIENALNVQNIKHIDCEEYGSMKRDISPIDSKLDSSGQLNAQLFGDVSDKCDKTDDFIDDKNSLRHEIKSLVNYSWYWGPISRKEAEKRLKNQDDGAFLVRDSSDAHYLFSLSFRSYGRTLHTRIEYNNGLFSFYSHSSSEGSASLIKLIEESISNSQEGVFCYSRGRSPTSPSFPVRLTRPVSRFSEVRDLQYMCRFVIKHHSLCNQFQNIEIPNSIKGFIENGHY